MNRRSFFKSIAKGVLTAATACYAPRLLEDDPVDYMRFSWERGMEVPDPAALLRRWGNLQAEQRRWAETWEDMMAYGVGLSGGKTDLAMAQIRYGFRQMESRKPRRWFRLRR